VNLFGRATLWVAMLAAVTLVASACSKGSATADGTPTTSSPRPSSPAQVTILSPVNGQVIHGSTVKIRVKLVGAKIVPATTTHIVPTEGHLHVYLDNQIAGMNFKLTDEIGNVAPGMHVLRVEFVASDHLPWDPRIFSQVTFEVKA
jgi:hypothetical protein